MLLLLSFFPRDTKRAYEFSPCKFFNCSCFITNQNNIEFQNGEISPYLQYLSLHSSAVTLFHIHRTNSLAQQCHSICWNKLN